MKEIKDQFSLVGGPLKASTKSHILASTSDIYDEFQETYQNVINGYNSNSLDAFLVQNKGIITEIIDSTKIQTLTKTTLNVGDLCLGIYKDNTQTDSKYDYLNGEYLIPRYKSVYFKITQISNDCITVSVEKDEIKPNTIFVVIGNTENGINFSLNTGDLKADFINVKAFKIAEDNIKNISGEFTYNGDKYTGTLLDKIYTSKSIEYLSNAPSLNSAFKSTVFTRTNANPGIPSPDVTEVNGIKYNTYDNPIPGSVNDNDELIWSDGIPDGDAILWASTRIFSSDGKYPQQQVWTQPKQMTDTSSFNVEFSKSETPKTPTNFKDGETEEQWRINNTDWSNTADEETIWMATNTRKNGVWEGWQVSKIKGEKGDNGTSISIQGSARKVDTLPTEQGSDKALLFTNHQYEGKTHPWIYLWNTQWEAYSGNSGESYLVEGNLYVWDGDSWENAGSFKGDPGESAYIHIKYAKQDDKGEEVTLVDGSTIKLSFTDSNGDVPGLYLGLKPDNIVEDSKTITDYTWAKWKGEDGFGYEYIYAGTKDYTNPGVPKSEPYDGSKSPNDDDYVPRGWSDNPIEISPTTKYCWMCHRQKVDGKWSNYKGVSDTSASLWAKWSEDGKGIVKIERKYLVTDIDTVDTVKSWSADKWSKSSPAVNSEDIYLWEWIHTEYSNGDLVNDYAIIGRMGEPGIDGKYNEYVYRLAKDNSELEPPSGDIDNNTELGEWTDDPQSVSDTWPYQWISEREYDPSKKQWGNYSKPVLWNIWAKGENSIHLDLDNQMDSMLYNDSGEPISSTVVTNPILYDGITPVKNADIKWELDTQEPTDYYTFDNTTGKLTVNGISADQNTVIYSIIATYKGAKYISSLTIKKLVGVDKYDLVITPNSFAYNTTTEIPSEADCTIEIYKTDQNGNRGLVEKLDTGFSLNIDGFGSCQYGDTYQDEYYENGITFEPNWNKDYCRVQLLKSGVVLDSETIPINKSANGSNSVSIIPSPQAIVAKKSTAAAIYKVDVSVMDGANLVGNTYWSIDKVYNNSGAEITTNSDISQNLQYTGITTAANTRTINLKLAANASVETSFSFDVIYNKVTYKQKIDFKTVGDGDNAVTYEIIPTNAYYILDQNNTVSGAIEGILYKITGDTREIVKGAQIECGYSNTIDTMAATTDTDSNGYFKVDSEQYFNDDWQDPAGCAQSSNSIIARYKLNNQIVAQYNVSLAKNGMPGPAGKQSAPLRVSEWAEGTTYYTGYDDGDPWSDVVYTKDSNSKPVYYRCIKKNNTRDENLNIITPTNNTQYWQEFDGQFESVATGLLLAENAYVDLLSGNTINIKDSSGNTTAGMSGGDGVQLWAGGQQDTANFRVEKDGDVYIKGVITATALYRGMKVIYPQEHDLSHIETGQSSVYLSNSNVEEPTYEDYIIIRNYYEGNNYYWASANCNDAFGETLNKAGYTSQSYGGVILPAPSEVLGKEVTIINTVPSNLEHVIGGTYVNILLSTVITEDGKTRIDEENKFFHYRGDGTGGSEGYISLRNIAKIRLVAGVFGGYPQWIVLDVETKN